MKKQFRKVIKKPIKEYLKLNIEHDLKIDSRREKYTYEDFLSIAGNKEQNKQPFQSFLIWLAVNGIEDGGKDYELYMHKESVNRALDLVPSFGEIYGKAFNTRAEDKDSRPPGADPFEYRDWVLELWRAVGSKRD